MLAFNQTKQDSSSAYMVQLLLLIVGTAEHKLGLKQSWPWEKHWNGKEYKYETHIRNRIDSQQMEDSRN